MAEPKNEPKTKKVKALRVHAKPRNGFRRAGFAFSFNEPRDLILEDLKREQADALRGEPNLVVEDVTIDVPAE